MSSIPKSLAEIKKQEAEIQEIAYKLKFKIWDSYLPTQLKNELDEECKSFSINIDEAFDFIYGKADKVGAN